MSEYHITTDLFLLPNEKGNTVLYAPLAGFVCLANEDLVGLLGDLEDIGSEDLSPGQKEMIDYLIGRNIINGSQGKSHYPFSEELSPSKLTLFPTDQCNLKCIYCYATDSRTQRRIMSWETASSAVEYYLGELKRKKRTVFDLEFHGGGEPFLAWDLIRSIVEYTQKRCHQESIDLKICASTNGMLDEAQLEWITDRFDSLVVSFDVLPRVQNYHRAGKNNIGSFHVVNNTLRYLDSKNFRYGIRCTVSDYNLELLEETTTFVVQNYSCRLLFLEPVCTCGSKITVDGNLLPDLNRFVDIYKRLEPLAADHGLSLGYSGARFDRLSPHFCYVGTDDCAVTVDGYLTNCWQVTSIDDPLASTFIFGRIMPGGKLTYDRDKLEYLRSLSVMNYEYCADCFAKWHCAGDCVLKLGHGDLTGTRDNARCETNRKLISYRIRQLLERENYYEKI